MLAKKLKQGSHAPAKTVKTVLGLIIDRRFLAEFTWSGKSKPGTRKKPFRDEKNVINLIHTIALQKHTTYTREQFEKDMVDKVFKFAYE